MSNTSAAAAATSPSTASDDCLPAPTGPHAVGRVSYDWVDSTRAETYSADPAARRELVVWIWYPAGQEPAGERASYLPQPWAPVAQFLGLQTDGLRAHSVQDAPIADGTQRFSVLVLSPSGFPPLLISALAEELASHGHVVVGVNHTYETTVTAFSDGRVVPMNPMAIAGGSDHRPDHTTMCFAPAPQFASTRRPTSRSSPIRSAAFTPIRRAASAAVSISNVSARSATRWAGMPPSSGAGPMRVAQPRSTSMARYGPTWANRPRASGATGARRAPRVRRLARRRSEERHGSQYRLVRRREGDHIRWLAHRSRQRATRLHHPHRRRHPPQLHGRPVPAAAGGAAVASMLAATTIGPERMWRITSDAVLAFFAKHFDGVEVVLLDAPDPAYPEIALGPA